MTTISRNKIDRQLLVVVIGCPMFPNQIVSFFAVAIYSQYYRLVKFLAPRRAPVGLVDPRHEFSRFSCLHLRRVFLQLLLRQSGRWGGSKKMVKTSLAKAKAKGPCLLKIETCWIGMNIWLNGKHLQWLLKKKHAHTTAFFFGHCYYILIMKMATAFLPSIQRGKEKRLQDWNLLAVWLASNWQTGYWPAMTTGFNHSRRISPKICV